jgi:alkyldihydroxyacetonephosphate synthase
MADLKSHPAEIPSQNALWGHKWGYADTAFQIEDDLSVIMTGNRYPLSGYKMPDLIPYIEASLDIKIDPNNPLVEVSQPPVPPPILQPDFYQKITEHFPSNQYGCADAERLLHSHGQTTLTEVYKVLYGRLARIVDMVFYCESTADAQKLIELAAQYNVCLVPFGGGTSVSGALQLPLTETRTIVSVDMKRMNRVEWIDKENLRAGVQAGITGKQLEEVLQQQGFVCGHEPDSLELSTLGGWIATNASGMKKNRYGNIEQIIETITLLTPTGSIAQIAPTPRASLGMQLHPLLFGNEGNLGLITEAIIKIHPRPQTTQYNSLIFPNFALGVQFLYDLAHSGFLPASVRLVDNHQFRFSQALKPRATGMETYLDRLKKFYVLNLKGFDPQQMVAATIVMEGSAAEVASQRKTILRLAKQYQGLATGAANGQRGYMLTYGIAYLRDFLSPYSITGETFETSVPWSKIQQVCDGVKQQLQTLHQQYNLPGKPYLSYRISQSYHTGVCLYFMFAVSIQGIPEAEDVCVQIEHSLRQTILANGGSISHHHGVGKIRQAFMKDALSPTSIKLLHQIKQAIDPQNIFGIRNNVFADTE